MIEKLEITIATTGDLRFIEDRQRQFSNQVGFLRTKDLEALVRRETVFLPTINGQACGVVICSGGQRRPLCLRSNIVEKELWENGLGKAFVSWLRTQRMAEAWGGVRVLTRRDLSRQIAINSSLGGAILSTRPPGARGKAVDEWWLPAETSAEGQPQRTCSQSRETLGGRQAATEGFGLILQDGAVVPECDHPSDLLLSDGHRLFNQLTKVGSNGTLGTESPKQLHLFTQDRVQPKSINTRNLHHSTSVV